MNRAFKELRMPIKVAPPPTDRCYHNYEKFVTAIREAAGAWVSLPLDEITGLSNARKQTAIRQALAVRGLHAQTTVQQGRIYVRLT